MSDAVMENLTDVLYGSCNPRASSDEASTSQIFYIGMLVASNSSTCLCTYRELDRNSENMRMARPWDLTKRSCKTDVDLCS